ncbi:MAG: sensor histidine kinase [Hyphomicrobiaceae bacterium]
MISGAIGAGKGNTLMGEYSLRLGEAVLRSRTREAEQNARLESEIANRVKSEFVSNMSHELRTPLNTVIGFSKLLAESERRKIKEQDIVEYARLIQDAASHLLSLINDILDISKIQSGRYTIEAREVSLEEVLEAIVASFRQQAEDAGVTLELHCANGAMMVRGDQGKLRQAISNIVSNAVKFTGTGGQVIIDAQPTVDGGTRTIVRDTGVGMSDEEVRIAATPFGQVDSGRTRWREGAGLGLPIAIALIELHGGNIEITSAKAMGTEVAIHLPSPQFVSVIQRQDVALGPNASRISDQIAR